MPGLPVLKFFVKRLWVVLVTLLVLTAVSFDTVLLAPVELTLYALLLFLPWGLLDGAVMGWKWDRSTGAQVWLVQELAGLITVDGLQSWNLLGEGRIPCWIRRQPGDDWEAEGTALGDEGWERN